MERLEDAIVREIEEEVGLDIADLQLLRVTDYMVDADDAHWVCPTYLAQTVIGEPVNREPAKLGDVAWFPLSDRFRSGFGQSGHDTGTGTRRRP